MGDSFAQRDAILSERLLDLQLIWLWPTGKHLRHVGFG